MRKKTILVLVIAAIAIGLGFWVYSKPEKDNQLLTLYGNVDIRQVSLAFEDSHRVTEMRAEEGDTVKAGQILATLDSKTIELQIIQAKAKIQALEQAALRLKHGSRPEEIQQSSAQVAAAQAEADLAIQQLKRLQAIKTTTSGKAVSQQDMDNALSRVKVTQAQLHIRRKAQHLAQIGPRKEDISEAQAQLEVARAELALLEHQLDLAQLRSPQSGIIRSRLLELGDMASPQRPAYTLALTSPKWVRAYVSETQLGQIKTGMPASVYTDSHRDNAVKGHINYISSVAEFTPKIVQTEELRTSLVYEVRILIQDDQDNLKLGMPVTVHIGLMPHNTTPASL